MEQENLNEEIKKIKKDTRNKIIIVVAIFLVIIGSAGGLIAWKILSGRVYMENSSISAPVINLSPISGGILEEVFVNVGDNVQDSAPIARVGDELIKAQSAGEILSINTNTSAQLLLRDKLLQL